MNHYSHSHHAHEETSSPDAKKYTCPMHPEVIRDTPGMCPQCGMNLVPTESKKEDPSTSLRVKHAGHVTESFLTKFWIALVLTLPIFFYSDMAMMLFGIRGPEFPYWRIIMLLLGTIVYFYCGWVFLSSAYRELKARMPGMMTLISIAITTAYVYSAFAVLANRAEDLLFELASLITVMLLGHFLEMKSVQSAQGALKELSKLLPDTAEVERSGTTQSVPLSMLQTGDVIVVRPGGKVAADGEIIEGASDIDESLATGESAPVAKRVGDSVIAGTSNGNGSLRIRVTKIGDNTFLAGVMRLVMEAQASKSNLQLLSDKAAFYLTIIAVTAGLLTLFVWLPLRGVEFGVTRMVAVLVIACPHALGLAIPLVASISTTMAAKHGFLIRQRLALEAARDVSVVLFDKTGTLTEGKFKVTQVSSDEALVLAAAVNVHSEHPIGKAIVEEARKRSLSFANATNFTRVAGRGAQGVVNGSQVFVGTKGGNDIVVERDGTVIGTVAVADAVRPESKEAVDRLKELGIRVAMITGDSEEVAARVAQQLHLDEYAARVLPEDKVKKVQELQARGLKVVMVGDGVNDAPALTQADVGIAIGAGANVAIESAGIVLVKNDPRDIPKILHLSKLTYVKMIQNLFWATGYNVIALPLAAGAAVTWGILLNPAIAAVFMSVSTVIVAMNAALLRTKEL